MDIISIFFFAWNYSLHCVFIFTNLLTAHYTFESFHFVCITYLKYKYMCPKNVMRAADASDLNLHPVPRFKVSNVSGKSLPCMQNPKVLVSVRVEANCS